MRIEEACTRLARLHAQERGQRAYHHGCDVIFRGKREERVAPRRQEQGANDASRNPEAPSSWSGTGTSQDHAEPDRAWRARGAGRQDTAENRAYCGVGLVPPVRAPEHLSRR